MSCANCIFLHDANKPHKYPIDTDQANHNLAVGCLEVMERELGFNICQIPTSYKANKDIENLDILIKNNISRRLLYASHFWTQHISHLTTFDDATSLKLQYLLSSRFLEWLEVMSVTDTSFQEPLAAIDSSKALCASDELGALIRDLKQFTSVFATPIHQSVPHIYVSALAFAPTSSVIYELCRQFPQSVRLRQGRIAD